MMTLSRRFASLTIAAAFGAALSMVAVDADARISRGGSFGSRGSRSFTAPPAPQAAPRAPASTTQQQAARPPVAPAARPGGFLNRGGLMGGLAAGFLGAGLFGMLSGHGMFGGLGGLSSMLGLLLQVGIVFFVGRWLYRMWQRRSGATPAYAGGAMPGSDRSPAANQTYRQAPSSVPSSGGSGARSSSYSPARQPAADSLSPADRSTAAPGMFDQQRDKIGLLQADLDDFERLLTDVQLAYGRQDIAALRQRVTPEVLAFMEGDLRADAEQGVVNRIDKVKLLDGDLSEAWRDGETAFATVAMRYGIEDTTVHRDSGEVVDRGPAEVTEYWTFAKSRDGEWQLSAVQPVD